MQKRFFSLLIVLCMIFSLTALSTRDKTDNPAKDIKTVEKIDDWQLETHKEKSDNNKNVSAPYKKPVIHREYNRYAVNGINQLEGRIVDDAGNPLIANIVISELHRGAQSSSNGEYHVSNIKPGIYDVVCIAIGYNTSNAVDVEIYADSTVILDFTMSKDANYNEAEEKEKHIQTIKKDKTGSGRAVRTFESVEMNFRTPATGLSSNLGFSAGGAKDVDNFRLNIEEGYLPQISAITYEGLFYDYYFDTKGISSDSDNLFSPSYNVLNVHNQLKESDELWLSVGLNSNLDESEFERKKLNLVVVLDVSGSMNSSFDQYYYDGTERLEVEDNRSKLEIATETICSMLDHLEDEDRFGMVLFDNDAYLAKPMNIVGETDMEKIKQHIMELQAQGGTNMYAGMQRGTELYDQYINADKEEYENRIIFLTDAMPNRDLTDKHSLWGVLHDNAENGLYGTIIGVGVDFQTQLVEHISKVRGANYYSIHSAKEFKKRLDNEFDFMVTPLVFDLNMVIDAEGYVIKRVCGTPLASEKTGEIMKVGTLFPSESEDGEVKGGIILVELEKTSQEGRINLTAGYNDRSGKHYQDRVEVSFDQLLLSSWISLGVQKGVLLVHYADLLMEWTEYMRNPETGKKKLIGIDDWQYKKSRIPVQRDLNEWEQRSVPLAVTEHYLDELEKFKQIIKERIPQLKDETLKQEVELLDLIINNAKLKEDIQE